jgi:hypothetical protein
LERQKKVGKLPIWSSEMSKNGAKALAKEKGKGYVKMREKRRLLLEMEKRGLLGVGTRK